MVDARSCADCGSPIPGGQLHICLVVAMREEIGFLRADLERLRRERDELRWIRADLVPTNSEIKRAEAAEAELKIARELLDGILSTEGYRGTFAVIPLREYERRAEEWLARTAISDKVKKEGAP